VLLGTVTQNPSSQPEPVLSETVPQDTPDLQPSLTLPDWLRESLKKAYETDLLPTEVLEALDNNLSKHPQISLAECSQDLGLLFYRNRLFIPDSDELKATLLQETHDNLSARHPSRSKTYELLSWNFYWPNITKYVN
jgi:hypothetical protein